LDPKIRSSYDDLSKYDFVSKHLTEFECEDLDIERINKLLGLFKKIKEIKSILIDKEN